MSSPTLQETRPDADGARQKVSVAARLGRHLEAYALLILTVAVFVFFSLYPKTSAIFPTAANVRALIISQAVVAVVALGALIPLVCNEWDLSVGAIAGVTSIYVASALSDGVPIAVALLLGVGIGVIVGLVNALVVTRAKVNAVIATLGMATILSGVVNQKSGGLAVVSNIPQVLIDFGSGSVLGIPYLGLAVAFVAVTVYYMLEHTPVGRYLYALGSNPVGARLAGLRVSLLLGATFVMAGSLCALAGILSVATSGGAAPSLGDGLALPALAAAFLSAASIKPGRYNVGGLLVAIFFLATLNSGLNLAGAPAYVASYVNGAALIVGVALAAYLGRKRSGQSSGPV